jgi:hypothetical protein
LSQNAKISTRSRSGALSAFRYIRLVHGAMDAAAVMKLAGDKK